MTQFNDVPAEYKSYVNLLTYKRPSESDAARDFGLKYLQPVMGDPDDFGNYYFTIQDTDGKIPKVMWTAHYDTVHRDEGRQVVEVVGTKVQLPSSSESSCLGADCTTGVWLILEMIKAGVAGHYAIFADEEIGCLGSRAFVAGNANWLPYAIDAVISFDRMGTKDIITHQCDKKTASDGFAWSLAAILGTNHEPDPTGIYTDSNEFLSVVSECTNISVGYDRQHTKKETQDMTFLLKLRDKLIAADWSALHIERDCSITEWYTYDNTSYNSRTWGEGYVRQKTSDRARLVEMMKEDPESVADAMLEYGLDPSLVMDYLVDNSFEAWKRNYMY